MFTKLFTWLRGYLHIQIQGNSSQRFLNLCGLRGMRLWNVKYNEDGYEFNIYINDYMEVKPIVKKTKTIPVILEKKGLPFKIIRYKKRKSFIIGILLCAFLVFYMSLHIWDINISGGYKYTPDVLMQFLNENGVYSGIKKKEISASDIEREIRNSFKDIGWVSAEIKGTKLIIRINEINMPRPAKVVTVPSHIIASKNGIVLDIITMGGIALVKKGDIVKKGDLLVSGVIDISNDFEEVIDKKPVIAHANIKMKTHYSYKDKMPLEYIDKIYTENHKIGHSIKLFNKNINLFKPRNTYDAYDIITKERLFYITKSFYLPLKYTKSWTIEYKEVQAIYTEEEAKEIAKKKLKLYIEGLQENKVDVLSHNVKFSIKNNYCIAEGIIITQEEAWQYKEVEESEWRIEEEESQ